MGDSQIDPESIHVIVIGAGLAGLAVALSTKVANPNHRVTILEGVRELAEIGVGSAKSFSATQHKLTHI